MTDTAFQLGSVYLYDGKYDGNYGGKGHLEAKVAADSAVAGKARASLTWLVSLENVRQHNRWVQLEMGDAQRSVGLINQVKGGVDYKIVAFGPKDAFGPTGYPVEILVCSDGCEWARTVISDREIERRLDDLFHEAFKSKAEDSQESMPPGSTLDGPQRTGRPEK